MDFTLNGAPASADVQPGQHLLDVLRDGCGVTSVKDGCAPEGSCGACTVIADGKAVVSCAQPAERFAGRAITTQEGLAPTARANWGTRFVAAGASQCGFCSPGILMKAETLLAKTAGPTREQVASALAGNLCRCTGYVKIVDAIMLAAGVRRGEPLPHIESSGRVGSPAGPYQSRAPSCSPSTPAGPAPTRAWSPCSRPATCQATGCRASSPRTGRSWSRRARRPGTSVTSSPWWPRRPGPPRARRPRLSRSATPSWIR